MAFDTSSVLPVSETMALAVDQVCDVVDNTGATGPVVVTLPPARLAQGRKVRFAVHEPHTFSVSVSDMDRIWHRGRLYRRFEVPLATDGAQSGAVDVCARGGRWEVEAVHAPLMELH